jgi:aspartate-semialdehyde dehydrogenase
MKKYRAGIVGATGMVGQRFIKLLENHPFFEVTALSASPRSAGRKYSNAISGRWLLESDLPNYAKDMMVYDAHDIDAVKDIVDFVFCAINLEKAATRDLETAYAKAEIPVVSNNSAHRQTEDVPMLIPEINYTHLDVIAAQRTRLGTKRGFIAVKPNCSIQTYVPALHPLKDFGITKILACTYQAISGAGKNFDMWPEMVDNVIPYIGGEEEKSEQEPLKIWGEVKEGRIVNTKVPNITTQCIRVPVTDGHLAAVYVSFEKKPTIDEIKKLWNDFKTVPQELELPSSPTPFLTYFEENDRPQTKLDRDNGNGMGVTIGRLREDTQYDYKFVCLSHNTVRGAAGGGLLMAELLAKKGFFN